MPVNESRLQPLSLLPKGTNLAHPPEGRIAQIRSSDLLPILFQMEEEPWVLLRKSLMQHGGSVATCLGLRAGQRVAFCHPPGTVCPGGTYPMRQRDIWVCYSTKGTRAWQPEAGTQGCLPLSAQELGPAPQLYSPGRSKGYFSSFGTPPILGFLAA